MREAPAHPRVRNESGKVIKSKYWRTPEGGLVLQTSRQRFEFYKINYALNSNPLINSPIIQRIMKHVLIDNFEKYQADVVCKP